MDDGNKEDWEDQDRRNKNKSRCGKHKWENKRSETEIVGTCLQRERPMKIIEDMEIWKWKQKNMKSKTDELL